MASTRQWLVSLASPGLRTGVRPQAVAMPRVLLPAPGQTRLASKKAPKKKADKNYTVYDKTHLQQFSLCDAMRYLRAFEVGRPPASVAYDVALKLQTRRDGAIIRDRIRLPNPCISDYRIAVVCPEDSETARLAREDGAVAVGEASLFAAIKAGDIAFNMLLCHIDSMPALIKAGVAPLLGPRGLMPSIKTKTVTPDVRALMRDIAGSESYRERQGVIRMAIGQLSFTPKMLGDNIRAFITQIRRDMRKVEQATPKTIDEVVLSSTNGPAFSLNGEFGPTDDKITPGHLATVM